MEELREISRDALKAKLDRGDSFVLIEVLDAVEYAKGHLPKAVNIPFQQIGSEAVKRFQTSDEIVVYCSDQFCTASPTAARKLVALGFSNVVHYRGGKKDWVDAGLPLEKQ